MAGVTLLKEMFTGQLRKNHLDIMQDMIFIDFKSLIDCYGTSGGNIAAFAENVFGLPARSTNFDVYENPIITGSILARGPSVNKPIGFPSVEAIGEAYINIARVSGARVMVIDALNLVLQQPVIDEALSHTLDYNLSSLVTSMDDL